MSMYRELSNSRIDELANLLPEQPGGFGRPCSDRDAWDNPERRRLFGSAIAEAETRLTSRFPAWNDDAYLEFSRTGKRPRGERSAWLAPAVFAE